MPRRRPSPPTRTPDGPRSRTPVAITAQPAYRRWRRRRALALGVIVVGITIALSHMIEHLGRLHVLPGVVQDLVLGYPMAAALIVVGLIAYPR